MAFKMKSSVEEKLAPQMRSPVRRITDPSQSRQDRPLSTDSSLSEYEDLNFDDLYGVTPDGFYDTTEMGYKYNVATYGNYFEKKLKKGRYAYTERVLVLNQNNRRFLRDDMSYFEGKEGDEDVAYSSALESFKPFGGHRKHGGGIFDVIETTKIENKNGDIEQIIVRSKDKTSTYTYNPENGKLLNIDEQDADNHFDLRPDRFETRDALSDLGIGTRSETYSNYY